MEMEVEASSLQSLLVAKDRRSVALGDLRVLPDEILCNILARLTPRDVARLSCASSVMYIFCNEEPLWMSLCLNNADSQLQYKGSWKRSTLHQFHLSNEYGGPCRKQLHFEGFSSIFLYRRLYRCYTMLDGFSFDNNNVERKRDLSLEEFSLKYDGQKPILISGLTDTWPAKHKWTTDQLLLTYGDTSFKISQRSSQKISMKLRDYVLYMQTQHDEDPLYVFDEKFGEVAAGLLQDYSVPRLFQEDLFDVLDGDKRPLFRWLIVGPERSGASWHVDPALTSAWNTLLSGRKRWALYPPGRVPSGVTVHVNDDDGDVNIETPSSLQWWLEFYPLLVDEDKPIEFTQLPGETIYVPSGWWHCVLNLETTIAVTQNFVNSKNFEFVCLDMAPGYRHKGVCRAGLLALDEGSFKDTKKSTLQTNDSLSYSDLTRKEKRVRISEHGEDPSHTTTSNGASDSCQEFSYDINYLKIFLDRERDHYSSLWSSSNCIGPRVLREWLWKLWVIKPALRNLIWRGACLALSAEKWYECTKKICAFHELPLPIDDERLSIGMGSNPVFLVADNVIKIYVEEGLEASLHALGTELEFYNLLHEANSPLENHIPNVLASGIIFLENESYKILPWDGRGVPDVITKSNLILEDCKEVDFPFGIRSKKQYEYRKAGMSTVESIGSSGLSRIWPYIVTKRCRGKIFAELRDTLSWKDILNLASFLGEQLQNLHLLPCPPLNDLIYWDGRQKTESSCGNRFTEDTTGKIKFLDWEFFIQNLNKKKKGVSSRLTKWANPIPSVLIEKVEEYLPNDFAESFNVSEDDNGYKSCSWIHSDIMDDNIHMEPHWVSSTEYTSDANLVNDNDLICSSGYREGKSWHPCHILDFSDVSIGDPICDIIPMHVDVFRGDPRLLKKFLESYKLPLARRIPHNESTKAGAKFGRLSYLAMCYCILHEENILGAIFSQWEQLRIAMSWEEVEEVVWGALNDYPGVQV